MMVDFHLDYNNNVSCFWLTWLFLLLHVNLMFIWIKYFVVWVEPSRSQTWFCIFNLAILVFSQFLVMAPLWLEWKNAATPALSGYVWAPLCLLLQHSRNFPMVWLHIRYWVALNIFIGLKKDFATISSNQSTVSCTRHSLPLRAINTHMDRKNIQKYILSVLCCCFLMMVLFWLSIPAHWKKCKRISHWVNSLKDNSFKFKLISFTSLSLL